MSFAMRITRFLVLAQSHTRLSSWINFVARQRLSTIAETAHRRPYVPRRACIYVPGSERNKIAKATSLGADSVILDCEDGVAINRKVEAREIIRETLDTVDFGRSERTVRVNSESSGLMEEDLIAIMKAERGPSAIHIPKVAYPHELDRFSDCLASSTALNRKKFEQTAVIIAIESAMGVLNLRDILAHESRRPSNSPFYVDGVCFASDDFCADIGVSRTAEGAEVLYARQNVVLTTKAFRLQVIDMVHIDYKDKEGLRRKCEEAACLGFTGKQVIHPDQVEIVQEAFTPSKETVEYSREMVEAFDEHVQTGKGAFSFRNKMIDMPSVLQARHVLDMDAKIRQT